MKGKEFLQCQHFGCLQDGGILTPLVLPVSSQDKERLASKEAIVLMFEGR